MIDLCVIGGGISGLTTAVAAAELGHRVTLCFVGEGSAGDQEQALRTFCRQAMQTTSAAAAAYWSPFYVGHYRRQWAIDSLQRYRALAGSFDKKECGVFKGRLLHLFATEEEIEQAMENSFWWTSLPDVRSNEQQLVQVERQAAVYVGEIELAYALRATVPVIDSTVYLQFLAKRARSLGVKFYPSKTKVELSRAREQFKGVIFCGGYESSDQLQKDDIQPVTALYGQLVSVDRGQCKLREDVIIFHTGDPSRLLYYVHTVNEQIAWLGGTALKCDVARQNGRMPEPLEEENLRMLRQASEVIGPLRSASSDEYQRTRAGKRPYRKSVRVEVLEPAEPNRGMLVANYGHGGAGYTLAWGCAAEAIRLVEEACDQASLADNLVDLDQLGELPTA